MPTFAELAARLPAHHARFSADPTQPYTAVIVPSLSFDPVELAKIEGVAHYEERQLFALMLLRHPRLKVVYLTSKRLDPLVVDYFLSQLRGVPTEHARRRLVLLDCDDASPRPLTQKILERPRLMQRIGAAIDDTDMAHMSVFTSTHYEQELAQRLGIPLNACDPALRPLGSKTGSRRTFREAGLTLPTGREGLRDTDDLVLALDEVCREVPDIERMVVKLDESFSGEGNAVLDLRPLSERTPDTLRAALRTMRFEAADTDWDSYAAQFDKLGGICEQWVEGDGKTSPSVQLRITPAGMVQPISTHDQVLGGPSGQVFLGATFPANGAYRLPLQEAGRRVGERLAEQGVIGRFAVDFLAVPRAGTHQLYAVEINLRAGGTTHPFNTLKFLTDGEYDEATGVFHARNGEERCYFATDVCQSPRYKGILPFDLIDELVIEGQHFRSDDTGVVFHLLGCLSEYGKLGCTAIAPTIPEAHRLYDRTVALLERLAEG